ncbi:MAG TPA: glucosidase, partial [Cyclobacteriaceae bacterium]
MTAEQKRLIEDKDKIKNWRKFGPYLTERQWGTVREDYSKYGNAWEYVSHDAARSKAYRWGEEGIGGISDDNQLVCFSLGLWNKKDPIIKERIFGLTGNEGNHAEDCKEEYYFIDSTPTHSYMKMLYKYPQQEFPYTWLVQENKRRGKLDREFELIDTKIFNENKYFDVFIEYAKADEEDLLIKISIYNRGTEAASLNVLPQIWFRNTWAWGYDNYKPELCFDDDNIILVKHHDLGDYYFFYEGNGDPLFCENETNIGRLYNSLTSGTFKDGINDYLVANNKDAVNTIKSGTKAAINYEVKIPGLKSKSISLRLSKKFYTDPFKDFKTIFKQRVDEADEFYSDLQK